MALDEAQRAYIFEIFDFPPNVEVFTMWGAIGSANAIQQYSFSSPSGAIDELLTVLAGQPAQEAIVADLIEEWKKVRINEQELTVAEDVSGVVVSSSDKRRLIRQRVQNYVPLYIEGEIDQKQYRITADAGIGGSGGRGGRLRRG